MHIQTPEIHAVFLYSYTASLDPRTLLLIIELIAEYIGRHVKGIHIAIYIDRHVQGNYKYTHTYVCIRVYVHARTCVSVCVYTVLITLN